MQRHGPGLSGSQAPRVPELPLLRSRRGGLGDRRCRRPRLEPDQRLPSACRRRWPGG